MSSLNPFVFFRIFSLTIKKIVAVTHLHFGDLLWLFSFFYFLYITCNKCTWMRLGRPRELHQHYLFEHCSWCWKWWSLTIQTTGSRRLYNLKAIIIIKKKIRNDNYIDCHCILENDISFILLYQGVSMQFFWGPYWNFSIASEVNLSSINR